MKEVASSIKGSSMKPDPHLPLHLQSPSDPVLPAAQICELPRLLSVLLIDLGMISDLIRVGMRTVRGSMQTVRW